MLTHLSIQNFAIVKHLDIEFQKGMTAITGETGAGKSISIDALSLCLGGRADANMVRNGAKKAEVSATFNCAIDSDSKAWLESNDLDSEHDTCIVRRVVSCEGRSRAYINGNPVPLSQVKELSELLLTIHGQHAHQGLLKSNNQRNLLDSDEDITPVKESLKVVVQKHQKIEREIERLNSIQQQQQDRKSLLSYQLTELDEFALEEGEFQQLEIEYNKLSNGQSLLEESQLCYHHLYESEHGNACSILNDAIARIDNIISHDENLKPIMAMLQEAQINVSEAVTELREYVDNLEIDPLKMQQTEKRFSTTLELARKHQVLPEALPEHHLSLQKEFDEINQDSAQLVELETQLQEQESAYHEIAATLSNLRTQKAAELSAELTREIRTMNMPEASFNIDVTTDNRTKISATGYDTIEFMLCSNKGMPFEKLEKAASGGELSRISLALQVLGNKNQAVPTLIFDEVDTGISGNTASIVGHLLRRLGENGTQVFCVTHLPQVAAKAQNQMLVTKFSDGDTTNTIMSPLDNESRIEEVARLLAGDKLTDSAMANAKELLEQ